MWKKFRQSRLFQVVLGHTLAAYLRMVWYTSPLMLEPADLYDWIDNEIPLILTFWHGQHFLMPFVAKAHHRGKVMISRHADADINAIAAETRAILETLKAGLNVAMTADVPKVSRVAGFGVVTVARHFGRPIYPVAIATRRHIVAKSWDQASVHLPFGPAAMVAGEPIRVAAAADDAALEHARRLVQERLDAVTARAEALVGRPVGRATHGR